MKRITQLSDFFHITKDFSEKNFYRGEDRDYGDTACVSTAIRDSLHYDLYSTRIDLFDRNIRENALFDNTELIIPFAQHSGLATKLLDITSNPLVALYFACQKPEENRDGYIYIFDDYADITNVLDKFPSFDLEDELFKHLQLLLEQKPELAEIKDKNFEKTYNAVEHEELEYFATCIENYREKYLKWEKSKYSIGRGLSKEDSPFYKKCLKLNLLLEKIKTLIIDICSNDDSMAAFYLPKGYTNNTPAIDFIHPYKEKRYSYYNDQYKKFDIEVREYLISLECVLAFISHRSAIPGLSNLFSFENLTMDFLPNLLYRPILTFKRGLSQQSSFFLQTVFDKGEFNLIDGASMKRKLQVPRQLMKCQANYTHRIVVDGNAKKTIIAELDRIGVNKATMFGDPDSIANYIMNTHITGSVSKND
ncbi:FRG domain protein [Enterococcus faecium 13.SD.W.09]|nr:FRG domain protein [Enterococcus faecium 13.SD.W.09]